ncbi:MAG: hypothetical protein LBT12_02145 [Oscillospiraceae bacterium]|jgi:glycerophosphoryl diester phosphodiesterase|nr:hypothetical protein [Oscillospiraceae bacterium]
MKKFFGFLVFLILLAGTFYAFYTGLIPNPVELLLDGGAARETPAESPSAPTKRPAARPDEPSAAPPSVSPSDALLYEIGLKVGEMEEAFTVAAAGLTRDDLDFNLLDSFDAIKSYKHSASIYSDRIVIDFTVEYKQSSKVARAYLTGDVSKLTRADKRVYDAAIEVLGRVTAPGMSDYELEKAAHDYIVLNCAYDYENYLRGALPPETYTPYGVLINGSAVCDGYSLTFKLLMDMLGIECDVVTGTSSGDAVSGPHAWNRVSLGGEYYLIDVTWDDPVGADGADTPGEVSYRYFNLTDERMNRDHTPAKPSDKRSDATRYNYYYYSDLVVRTQAEFDDAVNSAYINGAASVSLLCEGLGASEAVRGFKSALISGYSYSTDDALGVATIYFTERAGNFNIVAHAGGIVDGTAGTNSVEALYASAARGRTLIEVDLLQTTDGKFVLAHDWEYMSGRVPRAENAPVSQEVFAQYRIFGKFTAATIESLIDFLGEYPEVEIVTDTKYRDYTALSYIASRYQDYGHRFIPQVYRLEDYGAVRALGYERVIVTLYAMTFEAKKDASAVAEQAAALGVYAVTLPDELLELGDGYPDELNRRAVRFFVHTVNSAERAAELSAMGAAGVYSDSL